MFNSPLFAYAFFALILVFAFQVATAEALAEGKNKELDSLLLPKPRRVKWLPGTLELPRSISIVVAQTASKATMSTARLVAEELNTVAGLKADVVLPAGSGSGAIIRFQAGRRRGLAADRYSLRIDADGVTISGAGESGAFYGSRTLLQLLQKDSSLRSLPFCQVEDWPDYHYRMVHYDIAREQTVNMDYLKYVIDTLSYHKINMLKLYFENRFKFEKHPLISPPGVMTAEQARELDDYASKRFVELVPEVNTLGHMENTLRVPEYRHLAEDQDEPYEICATSPEAKKLVSDLIAELAAPFRSRFMHVGGDETGQTGTCPLCKEAAKSGGTAGLYVNHFLAVHKMVKAQGRRMMMWGDMLLHHKDIVDRLPKDIIIFDWHYEDSTKTTVEFFRKKGFEVFVCPAMSGFSRISAPYAHATDNIYTFIGQGSEAGAMGECTCAWELYRGHLFENDYFGIILSADRAWNLSTDIEDFNQRFSKSFFGLDDTRPIECYRMISDDFINLYADVFGHEANHWTIAYEAQFERMSELYGQKVDQKLLDDALKLQDRTLKLLDSIKKDCTRNRQALDFMDMPVYGRVQAVRQVLYYTQAKELVASAKEDPKNAAAKLSQAESLLDQISAQFPYFEKRLNEIVERFAGSIHDLSRPKVMKHQIQERKDEIAELRKQLL